MKKVLLFLICLFCICFIGCNTSNKEPSNNEETPTPFVEKIVYNISEKKDGTTFATLSSVSTKQKELTILEEYEGVPVTVIGYNAMRNCTTLERVIIPESIIEIQDNALEGCTSLKSITVPDTVLKLGRNVFVGCTSLEYAYLGTGIRNAVDDYTKWFGLFYNCDSLKEISIPFGYLYKPYNSSYQDAFPISELFGGEDAKKYNTIRSTYTYAINAPYENSSSKHYSVPKTLKCIEFRETSIKKYALYGWEEQLDTIKLNKVVVSDSHPAMLTVGNNFTVFATNDTWIKALSSQFNGTVFADNTCNVEGIPIGRVVVDLKEIVENNGFKYVLTNNQKAYLMKYLGNAKEIAISKDMYANYEIERVLSDCFYNSETLEKVTINDVTLSQNTFNNCTKLKTVETTSLDLDYIKDCNSIEELSFNANIIYEDGIEFKQIFSGNNAYPNSLSINFNGNIYLSSGGYGIPKEFFKGCNFIKSITINNYGIQKIEEKAFINCTSLQSLQITPMRDSRPVDIEDYAFYGCTSLEEFTIDKDYYGFDTNIGDYAFYGCSDLSKINGVLPLSIGDSAFENCAKLDTTLSLYNQEDFNFICVNRTKNIGTKAFYNSGIKGVSLGDTVEEIGQNAFSKCTNLTGIYLKYIGQNKTDGNKTFAWAFNGLDEEKYISLTVDGCEISKKAFYECKVIDNIELNNITNIGDEAFKSSSISSIRFEDSTNQFTGKNVLEYCNLSFIYLGKNINDFYWLSFTLKDNAIISDENTSYSSQNGVVYNKTKSKLIRYPINKEGATFEIPATVQTIGDSAFRNNVTLQEIEIPNTVKYIEQYAFFNSSLLGAVVGNGVERIGDAVFMNCSRLNSLVIGTSVSYIGMNVIGSYSNYSPTKIYYASNYNAWDKITICGPDTIESSLSERELWREYNEQLYQADKYYYSDKEPSVTGNYWYYDENNNIVVWEV